MSTESKLCSKVKPRYQNKDNPSDSVQFNSISYFLININSLHNTVQFRKTLNRVGSVIPGLL